MSPGIYLASKPDMCLQPVTQNTVAGLSPQPSRVHNRADDEPKMSADVARGHGGDGGGDDRPPPHQILTGCGGCLSNRGKGTQKPNLGDRRAGIKVALS
ncbi:hypothetical protein Tco_0526521 [Tanacetum coccineum]